MYQERFNLSPKDILEKEFKIDTRGYRLKEVDQDLDLIIGDYEEFFKIIKEYDKEPSWEEIGAALEISLYDIKDAMDSLVNPVSIFEPIYNDGGDTIYLCDKLSDTRNERTDKELLLTLKKAILGLKKREQIVLEDRYVMGHTQEEIAASLNISQAQVSRIEKSAISTLRRILK